MHTATVVWVLQPPQDSVIKHTLCACYLGQGQHALPESNGRSNEQQGHKTLVHLFEAGMAKHQCDCGALELHKQQMQRSSITCMP